MPFSLPLLIFTSRRHDTLMRDQREESAVMPWVRARDEDAARLC
jgi:hypothetical protein